MATSCPTNPPPPDGFRVWRKAVPQQLTDWAIYLRDLEMPQAAYGTTWGMWLTLPGKPSQYVIARKDHHGWTYKNGRLLTGLCIPGITIYESLLTQAVAASYSTDNIDAPDPNAALFSVDTDSSGMPISPIETETSPDWRLVAGSAAALLLVGGLFAMAVTHRIP